ncbi:amidase [Sandaracinobacter neustonicus]|uniref:Amidase n=1 Tax=Sandaracinobacter neustonicus TaxID=1715348 RepID=A0A501XFB7_9SPHN|nr:amidase [Sandaracinobacter neustonicus]TPE59216.1 amidase [Sandaracinobacter neustonicus]
MTDIASLYRDTDATGLARLVKKGDVTREELLEAAVERVRATDPLLDYMAQDCLDRAQAQAAAPLPESPLAGVPFLVKDLGINIAGVRTGSGSRYLEHLPVTNSLFVDRADAAGLLTFGKTATPELGLTVTTESIANGLTRNPWNSGRTAGGSSGGAAVAVAVGTVPLAQASDGGGSVRVPASCCGLLGLKTSRGRIPLGPGKVEDWNGLSGIGPISRTVRDAAAFLDVFAHPAPGDRVRPAAPEGGWLEAIRHKAPRLDVGLMLTPYSGDHLDPDVHGVVHDTALLLGRLGHSVREARPDVDWAAMMDANVTNIAICTARTLATHAELVGHEAAPESIEKITAMWRHIAASRSGEQLQAAIASFEAAAIAVDSFFESHDLLLSPTLAKPPVELGVLHLDQDDPSRFGAEFSAFSPFASLANISGCPAINLPLGTSHDGLPIGVMLMAPFGREDLLLQIAAELETEVPWAGRRPHI